MKVFDRVDNQRDSFIKNDPNSDYANHEFRGGTRGGTRGNKPT